VITISGDDSATALLTSTAGNNQWYLDGVAIEGATDITYTATQLGIYTVATSADGCTNVSDGMGLVWTGVEQDAEAIISTYPNPVTDQLTIDLSALNLKRNATIDIYDLSGHTVTSMTGNGVISVSTKNYRTGHYTVVVQAGAHSFSKRIIKK
jgi:hypothetical protein